MMNNIRKQLNGGTNSAPLTRIQFSLPYLFTQLFLIFCIGISASSQEYTIEYAGHLGGQFRGVAVKDNYAYVGIGNSLNVIDVSDSGFKIKSRTMLSKLVNDIVIQDNYLYLVGVSSEGLLIFNLNNPENPDSVSTLLLETGDESKLFVSDDYAYIADPDSGSLYIVDVSLSASPTLVSNTELIARDIFVSGDYAYVTTPDGLTVLDVSNVANPRVSSTLDFENAYDVDISGDYAFIAAGNLSKIVNISDPENVTFAGEFNALSGAVVQTLQYLKVHNDLLITGISNTIMEKPGKIFLFDITNPSQPIQISELELLGRRYWGMYIDSRGHNAYIALNANDIGFQIIDFTNPVLPTVGEILQEPYRIRSLTSGDGYLYIGSPLALLVYELDDPVEPTLLNNYSNYKEIPFVLYENDYLYLSESNGGFQILNVSDPGSIVNKGTYHPTSGAVEAMTVIDQTAYVLVHTNGTNRLEIIDVTDPDTPERSGDFVLRGRGIDVSVNNSNACVVYGTEGNTGFQVIDVSDPDEMAEKSFQTLPGLPTCVHAYDQTFFIGTNENQAWSIQAYSVEDPATPVLQDEIQGDGNLWDIDMQGELFFASVEGNSIHFLIWLANQLIHKAICHSPGGGKITVTPPNYDGTGYVYAQEGNLEHGTIRASKGGIIQEYNAEPSRFALLSLGMGSAGGQRMCPPENREDVLIADPSLTAEVDDWMVEDIQFSNEGLGVRSDIDSVFLEFRGKRIAGTINGDSTDYYLSFILNETINVGQTLNMNLFYQFNFPSKADSAFMPGSLNSLKTYSVSFSVSQVNARPLHIANRRLHPPLPTRLYSQETLVACVWNVSKTPELPFATIQGAIVDGMTTNGDMIEVCPGIYTENVDVTKELTIRSRKGHEVTYVIAHEANKNVFHVDANHVAIEGFSISGGANGIYIDQSAKQIHIGDSTELAHIEISDNTINGVLANNGTTVIANAKIHDNRAWGIKSIGNIEINGSLSRPCVVHHNGFGGSERFGGIWSYDGGIVANFIVVENNNGPGILGQEGIALLKVKVVNNRGPGIQSFDGGVSIERAANEAFNHNEVLGNEGNGIMSFGTFEHDTDDEGAGPSIIITTSVDVCDNSGWGVYSEAGYINFNPLVRVGRTSIISRNGHGDNCWESKDRDDKFENVRDTNLMRGGMYSYEGGITASLLEVEGNNGPGILAQDLVSLIKVKVVNNRGPGIQSFSSGVDIGRTSLAEHTHNEVRLNQGHGIAAYGIYNFDEDDEDAGPSIKIDASVDVCDNGGWGVYSEAGYIEINSGPFVARTSIISRNGRGESFWESDDRDFYFENVQDSTLMRGGIYSYEDMVKGSLLEVEDNNGPGILAQDLVSLIKVKVVNNRGPGIQSFSNGVIFGRTSLAEHTHNEVRWNQGHGIAANGPYSFDEDDEGAGPSIVIDATIDVCDNSGWGIFSKKGDLILNQYMSLGRTSIISRNGTVGNCWACDDREMDFEILSESSLKGGIFTYEGDVFACILDVEWNNGAGILAQENIFLTQVKVSNNCGPGIQSFNGGVSIALTSNGKYNQNEVILNEGHGIAAYGVFDWDLEEGVSPSILLETPIKVSDNSGFGIYSDEGHIKVNVYPNRNKPSAFRTSSISRNGHGQSYWVIRDRDQLLTSSSAAADGICTMENGDITGYMMHVNGNGRNGILSAGDVNISVGEACNNQKVGISAQGSLTLHQVKSANNGTHGVDLGNITGGLLKKNKLQDATINNQPSQITASSIMLNGGDGLFFNSETIIEVEKNNLFDNDGFGIRNVNPTNSIDAGHNWWGQASGPDGATDFSGLVNVNSWQTEPIDLVATFSMDTLFLASGREDTIYCFLKTWEAEDDVIDVRIDADSTHWLTGPLLHDVALDTNQSGWVPIELSVPEDISPGSQNMIRVMARSQSDTSHFDIDSLLIVSYVSQLARIIVAPDSVVLNIGESVKFSAQGVDAYGHPVDANVDWRAEGGVIDSTGLFTAGTESGTFLVTAIDTVSNIIGEAIVTISSSATVETYEISHPNCFALYQNYPNPFNSVTTIRFDVKERIQVLLKVYDIQGREIMKLADEEYDAGGYILTFDARQFSTGLYFYRITMGNFVTSYKMLLLK